jgi:hypothetical protein
MSNRMQLSVDIDDATWQSFERLYATDLVYVRDCWKLCGDAHCCSFSRYKARFRVMARTAFSEMPLLPYEYEFLRRKGWLAQFGDYDHKVSEYPLSDYTIRVDSIISRRPNCACDHATRPVICRLYPLLPVFALDGSCLGVEPLGIFEELEEIGGLPRACQLESMPFDQLPKFLTFVSELAANPQFLFYLEAYRLAKAEVRDRVQAAYTPNRDVFSVFESLFLRQRAIDHTVLKARLEVLLGQFRGRYGESLFPVLASSSNGQVAANVATV